MRDEETASTVKDDRRGGREGMQKKSKARLIKEKEMGFQYVVKRGESFPNEQK